MVGVPTRQHVARHAQRVVESLLVQTLAREFQNVSLLVLLLLLEAEEGRRRRTRHKGFRTKTVFLVSCSRGFVYTVQSQTRKKKKKRPKKCVFFLHKRYKPKCTKKGEEKKSVFEMFRQRKKKKREKERICRRCVFVFTERESKYYMIGNYLSTFGVCVFAYLYPLFLCFKVRCENSLFVVFALSSWWSFPMFLEIL